MCGIIGAASSRNVGKLLVQGLHKMEYRGYDSAGIALHQKDSIYRLRSLGKVSLLEDGMIQERPKSKLGIAHTRWATHGKPSEANAHPHASSGEVHIVHNGIIENYLQLREQLTSAGYEFTSETDSEVIAHLLHQHLKGTDNLLDAMHLATKELDGAYAIAAIHINEKDRLIVARNKSPLLIGVGIEENFAASDPLALSQLTNQFVFLEDGDVAEINKTDYQVYTAKDVSITREITEIDIAVNTVTKGEYSHFMEKEIYEQPDAVANTINGKLGEDDVLDNIFGLDSSEAFKDIKRIQFVACGTSLHAGKVGRFWFEKIARIPCYVDFASEYRYRDPLVEEGTLFVTISQSGETADTLAALRYAQQKDYLSTLSICNVPTSSLARESEHVLFTNAGPEIGVASTKAFTTQLAGLMLLAMSIAKSLGRDKDLRKNLANELRDLPGVIKETLKLSDEILKIVPNIADKHNALFLGRGMFFPIVQEGALKLKEISYIHAEAYPAGELKHGPLALVDDQIPVIALSPEDTLTEKLVSNLEEVKARGGTLYVFGGGNSKIHIERGAFIQMPACSELLAPIIYTIPLQILAYQVACQRGTDLDQPRNLAKSVTVE
ncbi:glutamine--fructose-6-phosphate transaminase (isomerizing) [Gammaproteobacteria bacterium]|nr:glutamine--fructose-6-phosphate transaminase (isomerizing) [Gammaproteobacteria bacterium]MDB9700307.1 glutamine--fructose-6-phosphate transaminase (isomerizing) [Gammaproteobacteria bacterium]MDC1326310.1 glutamine--fructose-6-phosphate transaminase (isomerizing) [Gammaproteobacteria bacterium]